MVLPFLFNFKYRDHLHNMLKHFRLLTLLIVFVVSNSLYGQKVALVLSGGGAKGIAHVGVLKALEEHEIPVDYIVGTSMGGIVAGCYAAGYSADEIEEIMSSENLLNWVNGNLEKGYYYYFSKEDINSGFLKLKLSLDSTFNASVTSSLASDLSLNFALNEKFAQASHSSNYNFDSLMIPARVVAADIFTQSEEIVKEGSLANALRTTLSVPFFYKPIRYKGKYLFDGGIYNNFPVDVAIEEFSPDIIIGSNVSSKIFQEYPYEEDEKLLNSSLLFMILDKSDPSKIPATGIYIEPNLSTYTAFDFDKSKQLIDSGYMATKRQIEEIKSKIERRVACDTLAQQRNQFKNLHKPLMFSDIKFHGFNSRQRKYIRNIFNFKADEPLSLNQLKKGYFRLVSEDFFRTIYPDITFDSSTDNFKLELYGRPRNNFNVEMGGIIATRNISQGFVGFEHYFFDDYLLNSAVNFHVGSFYKSAEIRSRLNLSWFNQFYIEPIITYNNWDFINSDDFFVRDASPTILERTDRKYGVDLGMPLGPNYKLVVDGAWVDNTDQFANFGEVIPQDTLDRLDLDGLRFGFRIESNSLNRKQYPSDGKSFLFSADYFNVREKYDPGSTSLVDELIDDHEWVRVKLKAEQYFKRGRYSTGYYFEGVASNQPFFANYTATLLSFPGFEPLQDSRTLFLQNFRSSNYIAFGLRNVYSLRQNLEFRLEGYFFAPFKELVEDVDQRPVSRDFEDIFLTGSASLTLHSPVGPINLSLNYYDDNENQLGVLLHLGYLLFKKKSLE